MPTPALPAELIERLLVMYRKGSSIKDIEHALDVSRPTIYKYIRSAGGIDRYGARPRHEVWHEAFDVLTDTAAYWVGLLLTDGSIARGRRVKLSLQDRDTPTLERLRDFVRTSAQPSKIEKGSRGLRFTSSYMCDRLATLGVVPRKTYTAKAPECLLGNRNFWRGVIDGDGTITPSPDNSPTLSLTGFGTAPLLGQWVDACYDVCRVRQKIRLRGKESRVGDVNIHGLEALTMAHWMYSGCTPESPAMERKIAGYQEMCAAHGQRPVTHCGVFLKRMKPK